MDDTKCWRKIEEDRDRVEQQETLDKLSKWADQWEMSFNADQCKVMHTGTSSVVDPDIDPARSETY